MAEKKSFLHSKTFWVNSVSALAIIVQSQTGFIIDPATQAKDFLTNTDWKVLRHLEQLEKNTSTSLNQEDYQALLNERQKFRESIKE